MACRAPLSHSAQPQHRAQSLEVRETEGKRVRYSERGRKRTAGRKRDEPAEQNERKQGLEQTGQRRKIAPEVCY